MLMCILTVDQNFYFYTIIHTIMNTHQILTSSEKINL